MSDELRRLPPDLDALLRAERAAAGPNELARGRLRQRLEQTLGVAMTATATTAAPATGKLGATGKLSALGGKSLVTAKLALFLAAGGGLFAAGYFAHRAARSGAAAVSERAHRLSPQAVAAAAAGASGSTSAPADAAALAAAEAAAARPVTAHVAAAAPSAKVVHAAHLRALPKPGATVVRTLADERALLEKARTSLAGGDGDAALAAVNRHAKLFPSGLLAEERDALRVRAMAARGDDVQAQLDEFQSRYPLSLFLPSVRAAVEGPRPTKPQ